MKSNWIHDTMLMCTHQHALHLVVILINTLHHLSFYRLCFEMENSSNCRMFDNSKSLFSIKKVQEKKVKKISEMNVDPSKAAGNGGVANASVSAGPNNNLANGSYLDQSYNCLSKDASFPPRVISSLRLPVVVVLDYALLFSSSIDAICKMHHFF